MAILQSPGVSVTVIDESFYTPAAPGTVPLIIVASKANKTNSAGTGTAPGTLASNAGKVYLLTSQMDLGNTFGIPYFQTDAENNPVNGGELNEYGLQAAYSFLGVANRAYVVRADLDTAQLIGSVTAPTQPPANGTYWFDTADTQFGVFEWNGQPLSAADGQTFANQTVKVISAGDNTYNTGTYAPLPSFGSQGDYAIVTVTNLNKLWFKKYNTASDGNPSNGGTWVEVGSPSWASSWPAATGTVNSPTLLSGDSLVFKDGAGNTLYTATSATSLATLVSAISTNVSGVTASVVGGYLNLYSTGVPINISGTTVTKVGLTVGSYLAPKLTIQPHYQIPLYKITDQSGSVEGYPTGSLWIKTTPVNLGANWDIKKYNATTGKFVKLAESQLYRTNAAALAALDPTGGGLNIPTGAVYVKYNDDEGSTPYAQFKIYGRTGTGQTVITSKPITSTTFNPNTTYTFTASWTTPGSSSYTSAATVSFNYTGSASAVAAINALAAAFTTAITDPNVTISYTSSTITITHQAGGDIKLVDGTGTPVSTLFSVNDAGNGTSNFYTDPSSNGSDGKYVITQWASTFAGTAFAPASLTAPTQPPADGALWYNSSVEDVDIMVNDGTHWRGYKSSNAVTLNGIYGGGTTDPMGPIISSTMPTTQSDGQTALANGDLWIDVSNTENFPVINKYNYNTKKWVTINNQDHTTENGVIFADARWTTDGGAANGATPATIQALLHSDFLDFDAPDPALYPKGMLLWNLRRSSYNVKRYVVGYVDPNAYDTRYQNTLQTYFYPNVWVSDAPNDVHGVGQFGRKAQRAVVVKALTALIESNQQIRDEDSRVFNLISCPGYLETLSPLVDLNTSRGELSFIVADAPARLTPDATTLSNWGANTANAAVDGEGGLVTTNPYAAVYYPWGYTQDLLGNNVAVPPSHIMLRTIALSDNVSYPWFAPAGTRRGGVTNASSVGYIDGQTGEFNTVALNNGQRDTLSTVHVNPITYLGGIGLVAYGQKTRQLTASSLDRINVARLVIYLRYQLNAIAKPYIFEPNDTITRNSIKQQIESMLLELTGQRALYDYLVVCDTSNNTPTRIDANELYVDIAIEPVKAVEFIYIPLRLENTGAIKGLGSK